MSLDEQLLQPTSKKNEQSSADRSAETAGALREAQKNPDTGNQGVDDGSLRSRAIQAKRAKAKETRGLLADQEKSISTLSSSWLRWALNPFTTLPVSFGLSFFYVYVHLFLQAIFGKKLFAPLGSEWFDRPGGTVKKRDEMGSKFKLSETMGVGCCTIVIIFSIIVILVIIALLVEVIKNPIGTIAQIGWSWIKNQFAEFIGD